MKRAALLLAGVALISTPVGVALAQSTNPRVAGSVAATIMARCTRAGYATVDCVETVSRGALLVAGLGNLQSWFNVFDAFGFPTPLDLSQGGFGGGGATGGWDCTDFQYRLDASGNLVVPSIPLPPGESITASTGYPYKQVYGHYFAGTAFAAHDKKAGALYLTHLYSLARGADRRKFYGAYKREPSGDYQVANPAYFDGATLVPRDVKTISLTFWEFNVPPSSIMGCPVGGSAGGDFDFYLTAFASGGWGQCIEYDPNPSLGPTGYAYNPETSITRSQVSEYIASFDGTEAYRPDVCNLSSDIIRRLADEVWSRITPVPGAPYVPVEPQDVRYEDEVPTVADLDETPTLPQPSESPTPYPTPTPSPTSTSGPDYTDPGIGSPADPSAPTGLMDPIFDWLPDLPSIDINVAGAPCPTWEAQPFDGPEWHLVLDSHCGLLEENRAAIGALMVVVFSIGAAMIILRA